MFPPTNTNGHSPDAAVHHDRDAPSIQQIVREETDDGRLIVRFLLSAMEGQLGDAKPHHRLDAARQLLKLGLEEAQDFVHDNTPRKPGYARPGPLPKPKTPSAISQRLAQIVREETDDGRDAVRFLVGVMQGSLDGFKPHHRLAAAKELLHRGFDDRADDDDSRPCSCGSYGCYRNHANDPMARLRSYSHTHDNYDAEPTDTDDYDTDDRPANGDGDSDGCTADAPTDSYDSSSENLADNDDNDSDAGGGGNDRPPANGPGPNDDYPEDYDPDEDYIPPPPGAYYDFADPPHYGQEPEEEPKPDPNALSKWELKAMKKGTLVWDTPRGQPLDSTTPLAFW